MRPAGPLLVSAVGSAEGSLAAAAALACAVADRYRVALLLELGEESRPRPFVVASKPARELEERFAADLPEVRVAAKGGICHAALGGGPSTLAEALRLAADAPCVVHAQPELLQGSLATFDTAAGVMLRADLGRDLSLTALAVSDLRSHGLRVRVLKRRLGWFAARRALAGALPPGAGGSLPRRLLRGLVDLPAVPPPAHPESLGASADDLAASPPRRATGAASRRTPAEG